MANPPRMHGLARPVQEQSEALAYLKRQETWRMGLGRDMPELLLQR
jgi:hypothetical protein